MGMESFFVNVDLNKSLKANEVIEILKPCFSLNQYTTLSRKWILSKQIIHDNCYAIDKNVVLSIDDTDQTTKICMEACYANYDKNIKVMYELLICLQISCGTMPVSYGTENTVANLSFTLEQFSKWIKDCNPEKYQLFLQKYGELNTDVLPNSYFYEYIRKKKK